MSWLYILPLIASVASGGGMVLEKVILKKRKIDIKLFQVAVFAAIVILMLPLIYFFWEMNSAALSFTNILIMLGVVIGSILANVFIYSAMKGDTISHIEPARLLEPLFTILLAILFSYIFGEALYERNTKVIISAIIIPCEEYKEYNDRAMH